MQRITQQLAATQAELDQVQTLTPRCWSLTHILTTPGSQATVKPRGKRSRSIGRPHCGLSPLAEVSESMSSSASLSAGRENSDNNSSAHSTSAGAAGSSAPGSECRGVLPLHDSDLTARRVQGHGQQQGCASLQDSARHERADQGQEWGSLRRPAAERCAAQCRACSRPSAVADSTCTAAAAPPRKPPRPAVKPAADPASLVSICPTPSPPSERSASGSQQLSRIPACPVSPTRQPLQRSPAWQKASAAPAAPSLDSSRGGISWSINAAEQAAEAAAQGSAASRPAEPDAAHAQPTAPVQTQQRRAGAVRHVSSRPAGRAVNAFAS